MDLKTALLDNGNPQWQNHLCQYVCEDKLRFRQLMGYFYSGDTWLTQRSTLIILACAKEKPQWISGQIPQMVKILNRKLPISLKRNILRILQYQPIPEALWGHTADQCFNFLSSSREAVAVKAFSMTVIYNLTKQLPDLARELRLLIEEQYDLGSAGFKARGRRVLNQLQKDGH